MAELAFIESQDDDSWDTLVMGSAIWPGVATVDARCVRSITKKKAEGNDGGTIKDGGYELAPVTITLTIAQREEWTDLQAKLPTIHPRRKGGTREPLAVEHPALAILGITQIYIYEIDAPRVNRDKTISITMRATEWIDQPKKVQNAAGVSGGQALSAADQKAEQAILDRQRKEWQQSVADATLAQGNAIVQQAEKNNPANDTSADALGL